MREGPDASAKANLDHFLRTANRSPSASLADRYGRRRGHCSKKEAFNLGLRLFQPFPFIRAGASENPNQSVVPLVAGVLE
jgi:hypothetical protein